MNIVEVKNIKKKFGETEVIDDISFNVKEGETLVILGPSGSGKSTILRCINNLEKIDCGNIIINNNAMIKEYKKNNPIYNDKKILKEINLDTGMVFQDFNLFPHLTVKENISEALKYVLKKSKKEIEDIVDNVLKKMDLSTKANSYPCDLSGGQKQRVGIARCLALDPKLICMDEPTSSLDSELVGEVLNVIKNLTKEKKTMIIVTHEIKFAEEIADRIIFMADGKIVEEGSSSEVIKNPKQLRTKQFLKRYIDIKEKSMEKLDIKNEEPYDVLKYFKEISDIPRKSGNEKEIRNYLVNFALERNLEVLTDKYYNVIIRKEASSKTRENDYLAFQAHTDMICEKEEWSNHNFEKDPIELIKDGDFIKANGTTLGADNGIGVAFMLALLNSKKINIPNLECIFTVQEETTMDGARYIDTSLIKSKKIISLDNSKEGKMVISSANCMEWFGKIEKEYIELAGLNTYELKYSNFPGGHSGGNIADKKRGNPIKLGVQILSKIDGIYINNISGGSAVNIIPRNFKIEFSCKNDNEEFIRSEINKQLAFYGSNVEIKLEKIKNNMKVLNLDISKKILNFINSYENGALKFDQKGNQILSANLGTIKEFDDFIQFEYSLRSNNTVLKNSYIKNLNQNIEDNDVSIIWSQELYGFEPDYDSNLEKEINQLYKELFGKDMELLITQGVLEGGFFKNKINDLEYICIGAEIFDAHSPSERVSIKSLQRTWKFIKEICRKI